MILSKQLTEKIIESKRFIQFVTRHFIDDDCIYRASALAFATLFAIVPFMSVGFVILSTFPVFQKLAGPVQNFIFENFVPTTGKIIQDYLQLFAGQVSKLSLIGVMSLFIVALLVMYTIESAMNKIWRVSSSRHGISAFLLYWAIVSLAPVLLGLSLAASSYFFSSSLLNQHGHSLLRIMPFLFSLAGFTFLYVIVPNCHVKLLHGLCGGVVAAVLFEGAKHAFASYLIQYDSYQLLYGAFATIPIFFAWIYWVWFITLLGAEVSYALSVHHQRRQGVPLDGFSHALLWLYELRQAQLAGRSLSMDELINTSHHAYAIDIGDMIKQLTDARLIQATQEGDYLLSCSLTDLTLYELTQLLPYRLPTLTDTVSHTKLPTKAWLAHIQKADSKLQQTLMVSLEQLFREAELQDITR